jgi:putative ABC transport system permease protein
MGMRFRTAAGQAWRALRVQKLRSGLTVLGIVVGIGAVVVIVAAGRGAHWKLDDRLASVGKNVLVVRPGGESPAGVFGTPPTFLTNADAEALRRGLGDRLAVAPAQVVQQTAFHRGSTWTTSVVGTTPDFQRIADWRLAQGRLFTQADVRDEGRVCVLGQTVRQQLFPGPVNPVGAKVRVGPLQLAVVGVLAAKGASPWGPTRTTRSSSPWRPSSAAWPAGRSWG